MSAVFVRDNYDKDNWGGRGTSTALRQIVATKHRIELSTPASVFARRYREARLLPSVIYDRICGKLHRQRVVNTPVAGTAIDHALRVFGDPSPFSHDIESNVAVLQRISPAYPQLEKLLNAIDRSDSLMINLEGDGIFTRRPRHTLIMALSLAQAAIERGKKVHMLNGMLSAQPDGYINRATLEAATGVLARCDSVVLREEESLAFARENMPSVTAVVRADALFSWRDWFSFPQDLSQGPDRSHLSVYFDGWNGSIVDRLAQPYIAVGGSSAAAWNQKSATRSYEHLITRLKSLGLPLVVVQTCAGDAFLENIAKSQSVDFLPTRTPLPAAVAVLGNAQCFVSGRWHPSIMASLNGTPCVMLGSNSHKTMSLQHQLGYQDPQVFPAIPSHRDVEDIVAKTEATLQNSREERARLIPVAVEKAREAMSVAELL